MELAHLPLFFFLELLKFLHPFLFLLLQFLGPEIEGKAVATRYRPCRRLGGTTFFLP